MKLEAEDNIRVDKYLSLKTPYSRTIINKLIKSNNVLVNNKPTKSSYILNIGDIINIDYTEENKEVFKEEMPLDIVYEDDYLLIINKPSGLVVHPGAGNLNHTLLNGVANYTELDESSRPGVVHRIDKDTSGLIIFTKTLKMHEEISKMLEHHDIKRTYIALLVGSLPFNKANIDAPIGRDDKSRIKMKINGLNAKKALTHLEVLKRYKDYTLVKLNLETGRTHQIRVHMNYIGYPVYNDPVYGKKVDAFGQFLHSKEISFIEPITNKEIYCEAPLPKEFDEFLKKLDCNNK